MSVLLLYLYCIKDIEMIITLRLIGLSSTQNSFSCGFLSGAANFFDGACPGTTQFTLTQMPLIINLMTIIAHTLETI